MGFLAEIAPLEAGKDKTP